MKTNNKFLEKLNKYRAIDSEIHKIKKKCNSELKNNKIVSITYDNSNKLLLIPEKDVDQTLHVLRDVDKDSIDASTLDETLDTSTESINLCATALSRNTLDRVFPAFDSIIKDNDGKLYGTRLGTINYIGDGHTIQVSPTTDLNRVENNVFTYQVIDKRTESTTNFVFDKFYYQDPVLNFKLKESNIQSSTILADSEMLLLCKTTLDILRNGTDEEKYSLVFDRYSLSKNRRYQLLSQMAVEFFDGYMTYFDGIHVRNGEFVKTLDNGMREYKIYTPSNVYTGINATESNTYTHSFKLVINDNDIMVGFSYIEKLDYCVVLENNAFQKYYRTVISCIHSGNNVYKYTGTNTAIKNRYGYLKSGSATAPTGDVTYEIYVTHNASGTDSDVAKGINADASNTYTKRYSFQLDKYNSVKDNGTYNASSAPDFAYSRVVESNTRFVNYLRNPVYRKLTHTTSEGYNVTFIAYWGKQNNLEVYNTNEKLTSSDVSWEWHGLQYRKYVHDYYTTWYYYFDKYNNIGNLLKTETRRDRWWDD